MDDFYFLDMQQAYYSYLVAMIDYHSSREKEIDNQLYYRQSNPQTLRVFISYVFSNMHCSLEVYVLSLIYLERLHDKCPCLLCYNNAELLILISIVLAQKYHEETSYCHSFYTKLANVPISRLNCLEVDFINRIEFALYVSASAYYKFYHRFTALSTSPTTPFPNICLPSLLSIPDTYNFSLIYANDPHQFQRRARFFQYQQLCLPKIYAIPAGPFPSTFLNQGATCNQFGSVKPSLCYPTACCGYEQYPVKQDVPIGCVFTGVCCFVGVQVQKPVLVTGVRWGVPMQWR